MSIVAQFSWDDIADPAFENPTRKIWRDAVAEIAEKAKTTLPASNGTTTPAPAQVDEAPVATPVQETVATPALPEAPASVNFHTTIAGRQIQITLRDIDETRLLARLETLLQRFPVVEESKEHAQQEGWCADHKAKMKLHHGKRGTWWSHKLPNGQWCNKR